MSTTSPSTASPVRVTAVCGAAPDHPRPPRQSVLVVVNPDYVEVFADDNVDVKIVEPVVMYTPEGERLADELLDARLPRRYDELHVPRHLRAVHAIQPIRPVDLAERDLKLSLVRECRAICAEQEEDVTWTL